MKPITPPVRAMRSLQAANRVNFNIPEEEIGFTGEGMGSLGTSGAAGRLRVAAGNSKKLQKDAAKVRARTPARVGCAGLRGFRPRRQIVAKKYGTSGAASGLSSSLAFTPIQGIELVNPNQVRPRLFRELVYVFASS